MTNRTVCELLPFLKPEARADVKQLSLEYLTGLPLSEDGLMILRKREVLEALAQLLIQPCSDAIQRNHVNEVYKILINACADEEVSWRLIHVNEPMVIPYFFTYISDKESFFVDHACKLMSNITRHLKCSRIVARQIKDNGIDIEKLVYAFQYEDFNVHKNNLHYIATALCNLTQIPELRSIFMERNLCIIQRLLPFISYEKSLIRRGGVAGIVRNCCFDTEHHEWLISDDIDVIPRLLLPLAGGEEYDEDEMQKLADDLQYLPPDKQREPDADIRKLLLEALYQLCATKTGRETLRNKGTYYIIRELHKWETDESTSTACLNLIEVLIRDEHDIGCDNLRTVVSE